MSVTPRERRVSRNYIAQNAFLVILVTPRERRVSRNIPSTEEIVDHSIVTPRERRVSRNRARLLCRRNVGVTPRERRVSRNRSRMRTTTKFWVTPRERRVSRNYLLNTLPPDLQGHASREACE